jgi:hypothetical protein
MAAIVFAFNCYVPPPATATEKSQKTKETQQNKIAAHKAWEVKLINPPRQSSRSTPSATSA